MNWNGDKRFVNAVICFTRGPGKRLVKPLNLSKGITVEVKCENLWCSIFQLQTTINNGTSRSQNSYEVRLLKMLRHYGSNHVTIRLLLLITEPRRFFIPQSSAVAAYMISPECSQSRFEVWEELTKQSGSS